MEFSRSITAPAFISLLSVNRVLSGKPFYKRTHEVKYRRAKFCVTCIDKLSDKINSYQLTVIRKSTGISITELVCESEEHNFVGLDSFSLLQVGDREFDLRTETFGDNRELEFKIGSFSLQ